MNGIKNVGAVTFCKKQAVFPARQAPGFELFLFTYTFDD
jgi:hypothetical protein